MLQNIVLVSVIVFLTAGVFWGMWKLSKWLMIPIQIILVLLLVCIVVRIFMTKENAERLNAELKNSGIIELESKAVNQACGALSTNLKGKTEEKTPHTQAADSRPAPPAVKKQEDNKKVSPAPAAKQEKEEENFADLL